MTDTTEKTKVMTWQVRKGLQVVIGIAGIALTYFGVVTTDQIDALTASPLLATFGGFLAAAFTNRGSDSTATGADVRAAQAAAVDLNAVAEAVRERVAPEVTRVAAEVEKRISSYGKHAAAAKPQVGATYPGSGDA